MRPPVSDDELLKLLRASNLVDEGQLIDHLQRSRGLPQGVRAIADGLVSAGLITEFQAKQLLAGRKNFVLGGQYKVLRPIGRGGSGTVFLCDHLKLRRHAAVKVLAQKNVREKQALERFEREARAAAALDHVNIVRVHDIIVTPKQALLVMEYVEGRNLQEMLDQDGPVPCAKAIDYILQAAAGLQHAHDRGIIHRDVKPANLLLDRQGTIKILDMGLARFLHANERLTQEFDDKVLGTVDFMSPEQATPDSAMDSRTDIYSLGATLYALLTGKTPFAGNCGQKLLGHLMLTVVPAHEVRPEVPEPLSAIVARMMAKVPNDRYATAADVAAAVGLLAEASPPSSAKHGTKQTVKRQHPLRHWLLTGVVCATVMLVTAIGARFISPSQNAQAAVDGRVTNSLLNQKPSPKEIYRLSLQAQQPFRARIENREPASSAPLPAGWTGHCWKEESIAEVMAERVAGSMAIGLRNLIGEPTCQLCCNFAAAGISLKPDGQYVLRIEYLAQETANTTAYVRHSDFTHFASAALSPTAGKWETIEIPVEPNGHDAFDLAFCTSVNGPTTTLFVRSVVLEERR